MSIEKQMQNIRVGTVFIVKEESDKKGFKEELVSAGTIMLDGSSLINKVMWTKHNRPVLMIEIDTEKHAQILKDFMVIPSLKKYILHLKLISKGVSILTPMKFKDLIEILDWFQLKFKNGKEKNNTKIRKAIH